MEICSKDKCTGCNACKSICPVNCIKMEYQEDGFLYPSVDETKCIKCDLCRKVCPEINIRKFFFNPKKVFGYAAWNKNEIERYKGSSGGVFSVLAKKIIDEKGVVFGCIYDTNMNVIHQKINKHVELVKINGSKYVQSNLKNTFLEVKSELEKGRKVLFSGTPCQISGLNNFLSNNDNNNLTTVDFLCHGVPSPKLFSKYLKFIEEKNQKKIVNFLFRDKRKGWGINTRIIEFQDGKQKVAKGNEDTYIYGFANCFSLRKSCYSCNYANINRVSDITLGDFWGIGDYKKFDYDTKKGVSLLLINNERGREIIENIESQLFLEKRSLDEIKYKRKKLKEPIKEPGIREEFIENFKILSYEDLSRIYLKDFGIKGILKKIIPDKISFKINKILKRI